MDFIFGVMLGVGAGYLICDLTRDRLQGIKTIYNQISPIEVKIDNLAGDVTHAINMMHSSLSDLKTRMEKIETNSKSGTNSKSDSSPVPLQDPSPGE